MKTIQLNFRFFSRWAAVTMLALVIVSTSCKKEEEDEHTPPDLTFKTTAAYTYADKTVGMSDSLLIGCVVTKKEDDLKSFNVSVSYDGAAATTYFNHFMTAAEVSGYSKDFAVGTRAQAGTEKWTFSVTDKDGNITQKSIVITVQ